MTRRSWVWRKAGWSKVQLEHPQRWVLRIDERQQCST
jgi:hypothetical protein